MMYLGRSFWVYLLRVCWAVWRFRLMILGKFKQFLQLFKYFFCFFLSLSSFWDWHYAYFSILAGILQLFDTLFCCHHFCRLLPLLISLPPSLSFTFSSSSFFSLNWISLWLYLQFCWFFFLLSSQICCWVYPVNFTLLSLQNFYLVILF